MKKMCRINVETCGKTEGDDHVGANLNHGIGGCFPLKTTDYGITVIDRSVYNIT